MKKRKMARLTAMLALVCLLAACGGTEEPADNQAAATDELTDPTEQVTDAADSGEEAADPTEATAADDATDGDAFASIEEAALEEAALTIYASAGEAAIQSIIDGFNVDYPQIQVEHFRAAGAELLGRYASEAEAGAVQADVFMPAVEPEFVESNPDWFAEILDSEIPEAVGWPSEFRTEHRLEVAVESIIIALNPNVMDSVPTTWPEALELSEGRQVSLIDPRGSAGYMSWYHLMRETFGDEFLTSISELDVQWSDSGAVPVQEVAAGAGPMTFPVYRSHTAALEEAGAPIEVVENLDPTQGLTTTVAISEDAPHPNAARVFTNWIASERGREVLCQGVYAAVREGAGACAELPSNYVPANFDVPQESQDEIVRLLGLE